MNNFQKILGICTSCKTSGISKLQAFVNIAQLLEVLPKEHEFFDKLSSGYGRSINRSRQNKIQDLLCKHIKENLVIDTLTFSFATKGKVSSKALMSNFHEVVLSPEDLTLIDGFLSISAICELLDLSDPFTKKKQKNTTTPLTNHEQKKLLETQVLFSLLFSETGALDISQIESLITSINTVDKRVHSHTLSANSSTESPLIWGAEMLADKLELKRLGGVSNLSKITKSDTYVTTQFSLIYIILASLGGRGVKIGKDLPKQLPNKESITQHLLSDILPLISAFMQGWLSNLQNDFLHNRSGFHNSLQVWQALGIVIHELYQKMILDEHCYYKAGMKLSQLDYSKNAPHWEHCSAFKRDATNSYWINATGGGRTFRLKLADYFISIINQ
ncbi:DNA sulfur modification protein DndB [Vibrio fluminensis]|uniref:DNA sulfur modification protein DndB n=1 Tax=Vibrio fluminensis TaxID=2783614 RepID=UPI0018871EFA|nr:DNA sulfur modification protein DndB [Vibrio fluminensis]